MSLSRKQLCKLFEPFWKELPPSPSKCTQNDMVLIFDGVYLSGKTNAVLIARSMRNVQSWHFAERESFNAWDSFLKQLSPPAVVVIDGQKGLLQAVLRRFPQTRIQRCLVHVERFVRMCLSRNPKTEAGRQLWTLVRSLWSIQSQIEAETWGETTDLMGDATRWLSHGAKPICRNRPMVVHASKIEGCTISSQEVATTPVYLYRSLWCATYDQPC